MAPEILQGQRASAASDIYAVGMVAAEMLLGRHPLALDYERNEFLLIDRVLHTTPDLSSLANSGLAAVLSRALAKTRSLRPVDAASFGRELAEAAGLKLPPESIEVRDSYLLAAPFIGREAEIARLTGALNLARMAQGSAWLVMGESGVGKSRLIEELRSLALVSNVLVVRGQAVSAGGGAYQLFRDALRMLCLQVELSDFETSILGTLLPDLGALLSRKILPPPELDAQAAQGRLLRVIAELVWRQSQPVLLLLDDLQWADTESLALLRQLARSIACHRLMVVACAREEEAPRLPRELPELRLLPLHRLSPASLQRLCESMLGEHGGDPELLSLISRETEGNRNEPHNESAPTCDLTARAALACNRVCAGQYRYPSSGGCQLGRTAGAHQVLLQGERVQARASCRG